MWLRWQSSKRGCSSRVVPSVQDIAVPQRTCSGLLRCPLVCNMRFSPSDAASLACVSLTFFAGCDAFLVPLGLRPASSLERGRGTPFKRCSTCAVTTRMSAGDSPLRGAKRSFIRRAASDLFERRRHCHGKEPAGNTAFRTSKKSVERAATGASRSAGVRALVRKVVAGAAAALVLRTSLHATSATAIMAKPRPRAPQQQVFLSVALRKCFGSMSFTNVLDTEYLKR